MSSHHSKEADARYIIMLRGNAAEKKLTDWCRQHRASAIVKDNRMHILDERTFGLFNVTWVHSWTNVTIWDCWNRRHIYI